MARSAHARFAERTARQHGIVLPEHAVESGIPLRTFHNYQQRGRYERLHRNVYRDVAVPLGPRGRVLAAVYAAGDGALASHTTATSLWGLGAGEPRPPLHVTLSHRSRRQLDGVTVHRQAVERRDRTNLGSIPIVMAPLAVVQAASLLSYDEVEDLLIEGQRIGRARAVAVREALDRVPRNYPGRRAVRRILESFDPVTAARLLSRLESRGLAAVRRLGLPAPRVNQRLLDGDGELVAMVDFIWDPPGVIIEWDGLRFHSSRRDKEHDDARQNELVLAGFVVLRYSWRDLDDLDRIGADIRRAFDRAAHTPSTVRRG